MFLNSEGASGVKKIITISIIVLLVLGFGYFLFKISPKPITTDSTWKDLNLSQTPEIIEPREVDAGDYVLGDPSAKNILVVYEDFECPACANFSPIILQIPSQLKDTKVVFRHYPLPQHNLALSAAYAAEAAGLQENFWEYYEQLYAKQNEWNNLADPLDKFVEIASQMGKIDVNKFKNDILEKKGKVKIEKDISEALGLKIGGTPTIYFNGKVLELGNIDKIKQQAEKLYN